MLDRLFDAFEKNPDRMTFKFFIIILGLFGGGFCLLGVAAVIFAVSLK